MCCKFFVRDKKKDPTDNTDNSSDNFRITKWEFAIQYIVMKWFVETLSLHIQSASVIQVMAGAYKIGGRFTTGYFNSYMGMAS